MHGVIGETVKPGTPKTVKTETFLPAIWEPAVVGLFLAVFD
jgi:hypothetical protein